MDDEPDVSCVIPTFNDRLNVRRAVESVLGQPGVKVEVLLVDDCSDASTRDSIAALAAGDPRIKPFFLPDNGGQARARNIGAMLARGRYLAFLDQDDEHAANWYALAVDYLEQHPALGALSGVATFADIPARMNIDESDLRLRGLSLVFVTNILLRRSVFLASGGFPVGGLWRSRVAGEDGTYRVALAGSWSLAQCMEPALVHRVKEGGATAFFLDRSKVEEGRVVMTRFDEIELDGRLEAAQLAFWARARTIAQEVRACVPVTPPG